MAGLNKVLCPECGAWNPIHSSTCRDCGAVITQTVDEQEASEAVTGVEIPALHMMEVHSGEVFALKEKEARIGQDESFAGDYFRSHHRVSHSHCRIFYEDGKWKIAEFQDKPSLNGTWIRRSRREKPYRVRAVPQLLFDGSVVYIADCEFDIHIEESVKGTHQPSQIQTEEKDVTPREQPHEDESSRPEEPKAGCTESLAPDTDSQAAWVVVCPVCGKEYEVDGPESRVALCIACDDPFDQRKIARISPTPKGS